MTRSNSKIVILSGSDDERRRFVLPTDAPDLLVVGNSWIPPAGTGRPRRFLLLSPDREGAEVSLDAALRAELDGIFLHGAARDLETSRLSAGGFVPVEAASADAVGTALLAEGQPYASDLMPETSAFGGDVRAAAIVAAVRLGYRDIALLDLDRPNDLLASLEAVQAGEARPVHLEGLATLRAALFRIGREVTLHTLNEACPIAREGILPFRSACAFLGHKRLSVVVCPLTPRETDRAIANLTLWAQPDFAPYIAPPPEPEIDLVFVYNCAPDAALSEPLADAFARIPVLARMFRGIRVEFLGLSGEDDAYVRDASGPVPRYGYKAGPNLLFFGALMHLRRYRGFAFFMETDCVPLQPGWAQSLDVVCRQRPHAWVIGSLYRGLGILGNNIKRHINGNALYAVGDAGFWRFLDPGYLLWLNHHIVSHEPDLAFDTAWERFAGEASAELPGNAAWRVTQEVYSRFVTCDEIVNIAGEPEQSRKVAWSLSALREAFPYAVVAHGPVAEEARDLEKYVHADALARLAEQYMFSVAGKGLTLDHWMTGSRTGGKPFRWPRGGNPESTGHSIEFRPVQGRLHKGDQVSARLTVTATRPMLMRFQLRSTSHPWNLSLQEVRLGSADLSELIVLELQVARDTDACLIAAEPLGRLDEPLAITFVEIDLQVRRSGGGLLELSLTPQDTAALAYGARSAIGPPELRTPPKSASSKSPAAIAAPASPVDGAVPGRGGGRPVEPRKILPLRPRYRLRPASDGNYTLERAMACTLHAGAPVRSSTIVEVSGGRIAAIRIEAAATGAERDVNGSSDSALLIALPNGRSSLVEFLRADGSDADRSAPLSVELRTLTEELVCYWDDIEQLASAV